MMHFYAQRRTCNVQLQHFLLLLFLVPISVRIVNLPTQLFTFCSSFFMHILCTKEPRSTFISQQKWLHFAATMKHYTSLVNNMKK